MPSRWFSIRYAENAFRRFIDAEGREVEQLRAPEALALVLAFYREQRAQHTALDQDGDMLLWQWGPDAARESFTVDLTRQLVRDGEDQPIVQLALTLHYRWSPVRRALPRGNEWCRSPAAADDFARAVRSSEAYRTVASAVPLRVLLRAETV